MKRAVGKLCLPVLYELTGWLSLLHYQIMDVFQYNGAGLFTETEIPSWRNVRHWLHWTLSNWHLLMGPVIKIGFSVILRNLISFIMLTQKFWKRAFTADSVSYKTIGMTILEKSQSFGVMRLNVHLPQKWWACMAVKFHRNIQGVFIPN